MAMLLGLVQLAHLRTSTTTIAFVGGRSSAAGDGNDPDVADAMAQISSLVMPKAIVSGYRVPSRSGNEIVVLDRRRLQVLWIR